MLLSVKDIHVYYNSLEALKGVSIEVEEGGFIALVGANGAGKSTVLRAISGLNRPKTGEIWFKGQRIERLSPREIVKLGIAHAPEGKRLFNEMSVVENLLVGAYLESDQNEIKHRLDEVYNYFPILKERASQRCNLLSGGEQQMLSLGRALMSQPELLLMDEPSLGLSPVMAQTVVEILTTLQQRGIGLILVEQNAELALHISTRCYVLETGRVIIEGKSKEVRNDERVRKAYLGI